jgi:hypothetical protein
MYQVPTTYHLCSLCSLSPAPTTTNKRVFNVQVSHTASTKDPTFL